MDSALKRTCAKRGIRLIHSKPYRPQGRGKIERFFGSVRSQFLSEITVLEAPVQLVAPGTGGGPDEDRPGSMIGSLAELNALFSSWVHITYHRTVHTTTGQAPLPRWEAGWEHQSPDRRLQDAINDGIPLVNHPQDVEDRDGVVAGEHPPGRSDAGWNPRRTCL